MTPKQDDAGLRLQGYVVAYLDIAGQTSKLEELRHVKWWTGDDATRKLLKETYGSVKRFRHLHEAFVKGSSGASPVEGVFLASNPTEEQRRIWNAARSGEKQVHYQYLADCIIAYVPLRMVEGVFPFEAIFTVMGQCCHSILAAFCERRAIRGGLAIGPCVHDPVSGEVYGSALSEAVKLESQANWFRVLVDDELVRVANSVTPSSEPVTLAQRMNVTFAARCVSLVARDADGKWILDYLGKSIRQVYDIPKRMETDACNHILSRMAETKGQKGIHEKYRKVQEYFAKNGLL